MANIFTNRFVLKLNIFTVLMADAENYPTERPDSLPLAEIKTQPGKVYPPKTRGSVSIQGENPKRISGALDASPHREASDSVVTKVLSIEYVDSSSGLSNSKLHVVFMSQGCEKNGWYKYENIRKSDGMSEALKEFRPTWNTAKPENP
ncbi:hypothetical protein N7463_007492 [Penicillium fimorum]|uniref:Uncharacterized protein n=1 Tax=Penicillium fimorum TaxID=1882269 RepID=A0A9X0C730_9EURO|nr:hypothetical protein N7463_007492 [Penicillium fimorum]